jgi:hypothetical protein
MAASDFSRSCIIGYGSSPCQGPLQKRGKPLAAVDVTALRVRTVLAGIHVLDHTLAQWADSLSSRR